MSDCLVSIIIPCYNSEKYLKETLDSVLLQTYSNWECLIVDDGSTDSSKSIALKFVEKDHRFKLYSQVNSGPSVSRNYGFNQSKGDFIQYLDSDDVLLKERLEIMLTKSLEINDRIILYSDLFMGKDDNIYETSHLNRPASIGSDVTFNHMYRRFALDFIFVPSCVLFPRKVVENVKWDERLKYSEDWDLYLQILKNNYVLRYISIPLVIYRNTPESLSKDFINTIAANYMILGKWVDRANLFSFSERAARFYQKNITLYFLHKAERIIKPRFEFSRMPARFQLSGLLIYPLTIYYLLITVLKSLFRLRYLFV